MSWSDEVAQTQEMESLVSWRIAAIQSSWLHVENDGHSQSCPSSSSSLETLIQLLSLSQSLDTVVVVQDQNKYPNICYFRAGIIEASQCSRRGRRFTPRGHYLPLVPISQPKHAMESNEAMNRPVAQESTKATKKLVSIPGPARSKKVDVAGVVQKTVEELLGTVVPNNAPLMSAGLDSIAAVDLVSTLSQRLGVELEPTALFDHPTIGSLIKYLDAQMEPGIEPAHESNTVSTASQLEAGGKAIQECFVVATAIYLPTVERSFTSGDLEGLSHGRFETVT